MNVEATPLPGQIVWRGTPAHHTVERAVLSGMITMPSLRKKGLAFLGPDDFDDPRNEALYRLIRNVDATKGPFTPEILGGVIGRAPGMFGGVDYAAETINSYPFQGDSTFEAHMVALREKTSERGLISACSEGIRAVYDGEKSFQDARTGVLTALASLGEAQGFQKPVEWQDVALEAAEDVELAFHGSGPLVGLQTGIDPLDSVGGLHKGRLYVIAARPGVGKTAVAVQASLVVSQNETVFFVSLEMSRRELFNRVVKGRQKTEYKMSTRELDRAAFHEGVEAVTPRRMWVWDPPKVTPSQIISQAATIKAEHGLSLVVVDQLSFVKFEHDRGKFGRLDEDISEIVRALKTGARELDCPVLLLHQANRESEKTGRPSLAALKNSGGVEETADLVAVITAGWNDRPGTDDDDNQDEDAPKKVRFHILKNRFGPLKTSRMIFHGQQFLPGAGYQ